MKKPLVLLLTALSIGSSAQVIISGKVLNNRNKPLEGVNVFLKGTIDGSTTDENGVFSFETAQNGETILLMKHIQMEDLQVSINLKKENKNLIYKMIPLRSEIEEVVITAGNFSAGDKKKATVMTTMDVDTTAGTDGDITGTLRTLPGTQQIGENGGLFVRGGSGDEAKITIDGLDIPNPFYAGVPDVAQRNRFSPHLFKGIVFNTGGYSSEYGGALSSILNLETKDHPSKPSSVVALIPYGGQFGKDFLGKNEDISGGFDVGYFNFQPYYTLIPQNVEWLKAPESIMLSGTFRKDTEGKGMLKWYGYGNAQRQAINQPNVEEYGKKYPFDSKNINAVSVLTYTRNIFDKWKLYAGYGYNLNQDQIIQYSGNHRETTEQHQFRVSLAGNIFPWLKFYTGTENYLFRLGKKDLNNYKTNIWKNVSTAVWAETDIQLGRKLILRPGVRIDYNQNIDKYTLQKRFSLAYKTGRYHQLNLSAGEYSQQPNAIDYLKNKYLGYIKANHYIANFQYINKKKTFRLEAYYKDYKNLLNINQPTQMMDNRGFGYARGIDIFWRDSKTFRGFDYWLSYTYLDTKRKYLNYPTEVMPSFATPHTGHIVLKYFFERIGLFVGGSYSIASGRPYYNPNNPEFMGDRTPAYQNANFNIALLRKWKKTFNTFVFAINNIGGNQQIFNYRYSQNGGYQMPITLPYKRSIMLGWFISIGEDRSSEVLEQLP